MRKIARTQGGETRKKSEDFLFVSSIPTIRAIPANPRRQRDPEPAIPAGYQAVGDCGGDEGPAQEVDGRGCFGSDIPSVVRRTWTVRAIADQNASMAPASVPSFPKVIPIATLDHFLQFSVGRGESAPGGSRIARWSARRAGQLRSADPRAEATLDVSRSRRRPGQSSG